MSLTASGVCLGIRSHNRNNQGQQGQQKTDYFVGLNAPKANGFPGEMETTTLRVSEKHVSAGVLQMFTNAIGKEVSVPVFASGYAGRNGVVIEYWLSGDGKPSLVHPQKVAAAS